LIHAHLAQGQTDQAFAVGQRGLQNNPSAAWAYSNYGLVLNARGDRPAALEANQRAVELDPNFAFAHNDLGVVQRQQGDLAGAIASFRKAVELVPNYDYAHGNLGRALRETGQLAEAIQHLRRARELSSEAWIDYELKLAERWQSYEGRLAGLRTGDDMPQAPGEAVEIAVFCCQPWNRHYLLGARFYAQAFEKEPSWAAAQALPAASAALRAAANEDASGPVTSEEAARLRNLARGWLQSALATARQRAMMGDDKEKAAVAARLAAWEREPALQIVRPAKRLETLPLDERQAWQELWAAVEALK
jgi:lipopolysaccharide biosynthesis regulator YciM